MKRQIIAAGLAAALFVTSGYAFLSAVTPVYRNKVSIGIAGTSLVETFDGTTYESGSGSEDFTDDATSTVTMYPGKTYEKIPKVKFTGSGTAYAYLKICVPTATGTNLVDQFGTPITGTQPIVTLNLSNSNIGTGETQWTKIAESIEDDYTEIVYAYNTALSSNQLTPTSPLASVTIANSLISNSTAVVSYDVPVTAYTIQCLPGTDTVQSVWTTAGLTPAIS